MFFDDLIVEHVKSPVVQTDDYYPFGLTFHSYSRENSSPNNFLFNGKEKQDELGLGWLDYGARMYMPEIGRWGAVDQVSESYFSFSPYNYVRSNPVLRLDPSGNWDITVHVYNDREQYGYGIAVVKDRNGSEVFRFVVRVEGMGGRDRLQTNADTPLGVYDIPDNNMWLESTDDNRDRFGPNPRLVLQGIEGEIYDSGRDAIRIHGGRQEQFNEETGQWEPIPGAGLIKTNGCLGAFDADLNRLKFITDLLKEDDSEEKGGKLTVIDDFESFASSHAEKDEREKKRVTFWSGFGAAVSQGLEQLQQWLTSQGL